MMSLKSRIVGFVAPSSMSAANAHEFIHELVKGHPNSSELAETLITDLVNDLGIDMFGSVVQDRLSGRVGDPDTAPSKLYIYPYVRPSAGAGIIPVCSDEKGEIYVAIARNYVDDKDHSKGMEPDWRLAGGYLNAYASRDSGNSNYDANLEATARRECLEELSLDLANTPLKMVGFDSAVRPNHPSHSLDAFFLADLGRIESSAGDRLPRIKAGDDVADACWINIKELDKPKIPTIYAIDKAELGFREAHKEPLQNALKAVKERVSAEQSTAKDALSWLAQIQSKEKVPAQTL